MGKLAWYKAEPLAFLEGTRGMAWELKCAYRLVIDLIYAHDARLPDDERFVAGQLGCDVRVWRRIRASLLDTKKLYVDGRFLRNPRCDKEVTSALASLNQKRTAGLSSAEKRRKSSQEPSDGNGLGSAGVPAEVQRTLNDYKRETLPSSKEDGTVVPLGPELAVGPEAASAAEDLSGASSGSFLWTRGPALLGGGKNGRSLFGKARSALRDDEDELFRLVRRLEKIPGLEQRVDFVGGVIRGKAKLARCGTMAADPRLNPATMSVPG